MCSIASTSCSLSVPSRAVGVPSSDISRSISASSSPVRSAASPRVRLRSRPGQEVLDVAERQPALADRAAQLGERMAALAEPADHPRLRGGGGRPPAALQRDHPGRDPALERGGRDPRELRGLAQRDVIVRHRGSILSRSPRVGAPRIRRAASKRLQRRATGLALPRRSRAFGPLRRPAAPGRLAGPLLRPSRRRARSGTHCGLFPISRLQATPGGGAVNGDSPGLSSTRCGWSCVTASGRRRRGAGAPGCR